ncbi:anti-sigma factor family protein [Skermanella pratensis]|uniref:anti-sigma factor family protein n=1 Tax=Skermanella pratensis TaxID=2233999 RepID=UPI00130157AE|nr:anti-sigma factor [Skermanella pratensis]
MIELTDEILVAYVDEELPLETRLAVEAGIARDPVAQAKVRDMRDTAALLRSAFPEEEPRNNIVLLKPRPKGRIVKNPVFLAGLVAAMVALVVGAGLSAFPSHGSGREHFMADVAAYHSVYAAETEHLAEVPASRKDHIEEWLGARIGLQFTVPDLSSEGWIFEGGRLLAEADQPIAQLLYSAPDRQPIALCITKSDQTASAPVQYDPGKGLKVAAWDDNGYLYIVVGALAPTELDRLTQEVRDHFQHA